MVHIKGLDRFQRDWVTMTAEIQEEVKDITEFNAGQIEMEAKRNAPGAGDSVSTNGQPQRLSDIKPDKGWTPIDQAIGYEMSPDRFKARIYVEKSAGDVAIWVEMGTGQSAKAYLVTVPPEWRALAQKYYINGRGTILARPYFLPAFMKYQKKYVQELQEMLYNTGKEWRL